MWVACYDVLHPSAHSVTGVIAICVAECISELVQLFPAPNAIVEYIRHLIDEDFGWAIGVAYWYLVAHNEL